MIETEYTPNPDTLKFLPGKKVSEVGPVEFTKKESKENLNQKKHRQLKHYMVKYRSCYIQIIVY